jgi:hypothetical protein
MLEGAVVVEQTLVALVVLAVLLVAVLVIRQVTMHQPIWVVVVVAVPLNQAHMLVVMEVLVFA